MEIRKLPHGTEKIAVIGMGLGALTDASPDEIRALLIKAVDSGINFFDACCSSRSVYKPLGEAIKDCRKDVYLQVHLGAVYNEKGEYGWSRKLDEIKRTFEWELDALGTDYVDFGFLHCVDEENDLNELINNGIIDYIKELMKSGAVKHIGFSSHTPSVAESLLDLGIADMMMFSINAAYDYEKGDEYGIGSAFERAELFRRCEKEGVGISVMKPFHGGKLLSAERSPFKSALSAYSCLQYVLDRPGVICAVPGITTVTELDSLTGFYTASDKEKDYSVIGDFTTEKVRGSCVYCNHCRPCPAGIDIGLVNKYYDLSVIGDNIASGHYFKLSVNADACIGCGHCDIRCPFGVNQSKRIKEISGYFHSLKNKK